MVSYSSTVGQVCNVQVASGVYSNMEFTSAAHVVVATVTSAPVWFNGEYVTTNMLNEMAKVLSALRLSWKAVGFTETEQAQRSVIGGDFTTHTSTWASSTWTPMISAPNSFFYFVDAEIIAGPIFRSKRWRAKTSIFNLCTRITNTISLFGNSIVTQNNFFDFDSLGVSSNEPYLFQVFSDGTNGSYTSDLMGDYDACPVVLAGWSDATPHPLQLVSAYNQFWVSRWHFQYCTNAIP